MFLKTIFGFELLIALGTLMAGFLMLLEIVLKICLEVTFIVYKLLIPCACTVMGPFKPRFVGMHFLVS